MFRILDRNLATAATLTASSADASFPVTNIPHFHRSKRWHSAGNFIIDATNNKIDFKESGGGSELTGTVSSGTYTPTTLAAAIKTALEAAGAETYTVSHSVNTGKWTVATSGAFLSILWNTGTNAVASIGPSLGYSAAADDTGSLSYLGDAVALHTEEWVLFDLGSAQDVDSFAILFDRHLGHGFSGSEVLRLQANASNAWTAPSVDVALAIDTDWNIVTHFFSSVQSYRYWRVKLVDPTNPNFYVSLPTVFLSKATQLTQAPEVGFGMSRRDLSRSERTAYGHKYSDRYPILRSFRFRYANLTESDLEILELIYERVGSTTPVMLCLDPLGATFDKDRFALYGYLGEDFGIDNQFYTYFNTALTLEEAA